MFSLQHIRRELLEAQEQIQAQVSCVIYLFNLLGQLWKWRYILVVSDDIWNKGEASVPV